MELLDKIFTLLNQQELGAALTATENLLYTYPQLYSNEQLLQLRSEYQLMADYWLKGYPDPQREEVCRQLLRRLHVLVSNVGVRAWLRGSAYLQGVSNRTRSGGHNWSVAAVRGELEGFVAEQAMLELQPDHVRNHEQQQLYERHQQQMNNLFDYIWTSDAWNESLEQAFLDILLSPTVDSVDQQLMVSAITLSAMNAFDICKLRLLAEVYCQSADERVRQRALVGWAFSLSDSSVELFPEVTAMTAALMADAGSRQELTELQMQVFYCISADDDNRKIQRDIMPNIMSNANYRVTRDGIEEVEEDPMQDILDPEASERNLERMEESVRKMLDMQKAGSDIYFGGFSQMKRYPFFNEMSNWFVPFYEQHPAISAIMGSGRGRTFLKAIVKRGPFCDSDKYSFALAFDQVAQRIPDSLMNLLDSGEAKMVGMELQNSDDGQAAYIRRMYLQNLYRFFRVFSHRSDFRNPFSNADGYLFYVRWIANGADDMAADVQQAMAERTDELVAFLCKRRLYAEADRVLRAYNGPMTAHLYQLKGNVLLALHPDSGREAAAAFRSALDGGRSEAALSGLARAAFREADYELALNSYDQLLDMQPDKKSYLLNRAVCLMRLFQCDEALKTLYRLNYETPDDDNVNRVLAWALVGDGKYEQAAKIYGRLLADEETSVIDDMLNYGYCLWFHGDAAGAATMFRQYAAKLGDDADMHREFFRDEYKLLGHKGISDVEIRLMLDQLA